MGSAECGVGNSESERRLQGPAAVFLEHVDDGLEEVLGGELLVNAVFGPVGFEALLLAVHEPKGDLLYRGVLDVAGEAS